MNSGSSALKKFRHSIGQNWYHVVITTKYRSKAFQWKETRDVALDVFPEVCKAHLIELYRFEVMDDHVHLFVACPPDMPLRRMLCIIKGASSFEIRRRYPSLKKYKHLWNRGAMYRSIGAVSADVVERYIAKNDWYDKYQKRLN